MSRSLRKEVYKDKPIVEYNKRFRRVNKIRIAKGLEPLNTSEITNDYDVCDYKYLKNVNNKVSK